MVTQNSLDLNSTLTKAEHKNESEANSLFFKTTKQTKVLIGGQESYVPGFYRDLSACGIVFPINAPESVLSALLPNSSYSLQKVPLIGYMGVLLCFNYRISGVGPYNEVALCVVLNEYGQNILTRGFSQVINMILRHFYAYALHMPVNTELALAGGLDYFGYPKFLSEILFTQNSGRDYCSVNDLQSGQPIISCSLPHSGGYDLGQKEFTMVSYSVKDSKMLKARFHMQLDDLHILLNRDALSIETGSGAMSDTYLQLQPGKPLVGFRAHFGRGILHLPKEVI